MKPKPFEVKWEASVLGWALIILFLFPILFIFLPGNLANMRNWHLALTALFLFFVWRRKIDLSEIFLSGVSAAQWRALAAFSLFSFLGCVLLSLYAFRVNGMDFSIFDWMLYNTNHRNFMTSPVCQHCNHFGVHPSYIMLPLTLLHRVFETPVMLQIVHALALWISQFPLRRLAEKYVQGPFFVFLLVVCFLVNSWTGSILNHGFHFEVFYIPLGLSLILSWVEKRTAAYFLFLLLFLSIKEDAALYAAAFAVGALLSGDRRKRLALATIFLAVLVAVINLKIAQPYFLSVTGQTQPVYVTRFWGKYGANKEAIFLGMLTHLNWVVADILGGGWVTILGSFLFLPLLTIHPVISFLPFVLLNGTASSGDQQMRDFAFYYSSPFLPFAFWGLVAAWPRACEVVGRHLPAHKQVTEKLFLVAVALFSLNTGGYQKFPRPRPDLLFDLRAMEEDFAEDGRRFCAQLALFPHLPYKWDLNSLDEECTRREDTYSIFALDLDPNPFDREALEKMKNVGVLLKTYPSGIAVVRGRR